MYSFAQRADTLVVDEPLYGHYLRVSGAEHPGRDEVLAAMETDGEKVVRDVVLGPCERPVLFMKQMAHHLMDLDRTFLRGVRNVLLIRDPRDVLLSLVRQLPRPTVRDTGIAVQAGLYDELSDAGTAPPVLDARELLRNPEYVLRTLLGKLGLGFDPAMLVWQAGPRPEDGVWAPHWYRNVHRSTGFGPYRDKTESVPAGLAGVLEECRPHYERLMARAIRVPPGAGGGRDA
jgi:hypothetical protein